jgi:hypothetical protein
MTTSIGSGRPPGSAFTNIQRFIRRGAEVENCELCGAVLAAEHTHLIDPAARKLACSCEPCALLFFDGNGKYRRISRQIRFLPDFKMSGAGWDSLMIPISMAFFFFSSPQQKMAAMYPSPAGPMESLLTLEAWAGIVEANPSLKNMLPDVEALLVNRIGSGQNAEAKYFIVPIDQCFKLTGLIRAHWRGLSGGAEVWEEVEKFFAGIEKNSTIVRETAGA